MGKEANDSRLQSEEFDPCPGSAIRAIEETLYRTDGSATARMRRVSFGSRLALQSQTHVFEVCIRLGVGCCRAIVTRGAAHLSTRLPPR